MSLGRTVLVAVLAAAVFPAAVLAAPPLSSGQGSQIRPVLTVEQPWRPAILSEPGVKEATPALAPATIDRKKVPHFPQLPNAAPFQRQTLWCTNPVMLQSQGLVPLRVPANGRLAAGCWTPEDPYLDPFGDPFLP